MISKAFYFTFMLSISSFLVILYKFIISDYSIYMLTYTKEANIFGELLYFIIYKNFTEIEKLQWLDELNLYLQVNDDFWLKLTKKVDLSTLRCYNDLLLSVRDNLNDQLQIMKQKFIFLTVNLVF